MERKSIWSLGQGVNTPRVRRIGSMNCFGVENLVELVKIHKEMKSPHQDAGDHNAAFVHDHARRRGVSGRGRHEEGHGKRRVANSAEIT